MKPLDPSLRIVSGETGTERDVKASDKQPVAGLTAKLPTEKGFVLTLPLPEADSPQEKKEDKVEDYCVVYWKDGTTWYTVIWNNIEGAQNYATFHQKSNSEIYKQLRIKEISKLDIVMLRLDARRFQHEIRTDMCIEVQPDGKMIAYWGEYGGLGTLKF